MTPKYDDALRGYAFGVLERDGFRCRYCGLDGTIWPNFLYLSWDHLLPRGDPRREQDERGAQAYIVAACRFCNEVHNRTPLPTEGLTPDELVEQKRRLVQERRGEYQAFWEAMVGGGLAHEP